MEKLKIEMSEIEVRKPQVFRLLFDMFYPRAYMFACRLLGNNEVAKISV